MNAVNPDDRARFSLLHRWHNFDEDSQRNLLRFENDKEIVELIRVAKLVEWPVTAAFLQRELQRRQTPAPKLPGVATKQGET
jgi:hypothetical protein